MKIASISVFIALLLLSACSTVQKEEMTHQFPPYKPNFYGIDRKDSIQIIVNYNDIGTNASKLEFINSIKNIVVNFKSGKKKTIKSLILPKMIMKQTNVYSKMTTTFLAQGFFVPNTRLNIEPYSIELNLYSDSAVYTFERPYNDFIRNLNFDTRNALNILPMVEKLDSVNYFLGVIALRKSTPNKEYLSSSEDFRAEIFGAKRNLVWSSNFNKDYLQAKQPVKPLNKGDYYLYSTIWNGNTNAGAKASEGDYTLKLTIPAQPLPYYVILNLKNE